MNYKRLGLTPIKVSEIGFGGAGIGHAWGKTDDHECIKCINEAIDNGINFFDTSPVYGNGKSEINLGIGLKGKRERVVIASKVRFDNQSLLKSMKENLISSVEESLKSAESKLKRKNLDFVVMNTLADKGAGFNHETNKVTVIQSVGEHTEKRIFELKTKREVAHDLIEVLSQILITKK